MLTEACFNKRADARPHDRANRCEFIVGSYYLFESLLVLAGRLDPSASSLDDSRDNATLTLPSPSPRERDSL